MNTFKWDTIREEEITENKYKEYARKVESSCRVEYCDYFMKPEECEKFRTKIMELIRK